MRPLLRWIGWLALALLGLQLFFVLRIALMAVIAPESTAFQRSEAWRVLNDRGSLRWRQQWLDYGRISVHLKRAVIVSEDDDFATNEKNIELILRKITEVDSGIHYLQIQED